MQKVRIEGDSLSLKLSAALSIAVLSAFCQCVASADAFKFFEKDPDGTTHINAPFVHVDVHHNADGQKDVSVDAPFTRVHPTDDGRTQVDAPFTKVRPTDDGRTQVSAPFTKVRPTDDGRTQVSAPFTKVRPTDDGRTQVSAPFTKVSPTNQGRTQVSAPFTKVKPTANGHTQITAPLTKTSGGQVRNSRTLPPVAPEPVSQPTR